MDVEKQNDYERRIDALCDALFHGDDLAPLPTVSAESTVAAKCAAGCAAPIAPVIRPRLHEARPTQTATRRTARVLAAPAKPRTTLRLRNCARTIWLAACLALAGWLGLRPAAPNRAAPASPAVASTPAGAHRHASRAIEEIRVGQRVLGENPDLTESEHSTVTAVDPATWRLLRLHAEHRWDDGTLESTEVATLQPISWLEEHDARVGRNVPIPIDLEELSLPSDMLATVLAVEPCPELAEGPGHLVLTTINHLSDTVVDLAVTDAAGHEATIGTTAAHRFYSHTRGDWVAARELEIGEQLRSIDRPLTVARLARRPGVERVYNMTVEGEHVYQVTAAGVLVHNSYGGLTDAQQNAVAAAKQCMQNRQNILSLEQKMQQLTAEGISTPLDNMGGYQHYLAARLQAIKDAIASEKALLQANHNHMEQLLGRGPAYP